jgi:hypothetical protein
MGKMLMGRYTLWPVIYTKFVEHGHLFTMMGKEPYAGTFSISINKLLCL